MYIKFPPEPSREPGSNYCGCRMPPAFSTVPFIAMTAKKHASPVPVQLLSATSPQPLRNLSATLSAPFSEFYLMSTIAHRPLSLSLSLSLSLPYSENDGQEPTFLPLDGSLASSFLPAPSGVEWFSDKLEILVRAMTHRLGWLISRHNRPRQTPFPPPPSSATKPTIQSNSISFNNNHIVSICFITDYWLFFVVVV